jgi:hypothetical protein
MPREWRKERAECPSNVSEELNPFPVAISALCALLGREEKMAG